MTNRKSKRKATEADRVADALMATAGAALDEGNLAGAAEAIAAAEEAQRRLQDDDLSLVILAVKTWVAKAEQPTTRRPRASARNGSPQGRCGKCGRLLWRNYSGQRLCPPCWAAGGRGGPRTVSGGLPTLGKRR